MDLSCGNDTSRYSDNLLLTTHISLSLECHEWPRAPIQNMTSQRSEAFPCTHWFEATHEVGKLAITFV